MGNLSPKTESMTVVFVILNSIPACTLFENPAKSYQGNSNYPDVGKEPLSNRQLIHP
ncbi:hypothetical protein CIHG_08687 [Coccidioides immitis H538.4]|uniref:Uncharacterized protein n=5 Tax=Coccidioides TaxID=5500 RepID=E9DAK7_COCPS|nr:conserved hypothetical protein [Coccidioides posadasii str. Silveira]KMM66880.1 hypothetical protein CPAG_03216 [Coccidioides posadasii RMSCC 3488]KMP02937.1 hypothetical protein CIRG_02629 [Coccidioides immitis RMSCC 2394]KMU77381.1 hypothetical protein CISG_06628 [Coccidioides immitis RMSCC 3703]KMU90727.1 hypothetical protein CIHG_08687 [Coccidioides immitis H538.4]